MSTEITLCSTVELKQCVKDVRKSVLQLANEHGLAKTKHYHSETNFTRLTDIVTANGGKLDYRALQEEYKSNQQLVDFQEYVRTHKIIGVVDSRRFIFSIDGGLADIKSNLPDDFDIMFNRNPFDVRVTIIYADLAKEAELAKRFQEFYKGLRTE